MPKQDLEAIAEAQTNLQPGDRLLLIELREIRKIAQCILDSLQPTGEAKKPKGNNWLKGNRNR